jgi:hypothetical protein
MNRLAVPILAPPVTKTSSVTATRSTLHRKCACGGTVGPSGECESCRRKRLARQRKPALLMGTANDPLEREADQIADAIVRGDVAGAVRAQPVAALQRQEDEGPTTGTLGFDLGPALSRGTLRDRPSVAPRLRPEGPSVVEGFRVSGTHCGCAPVLEADIRWNETVMAAYRSCDQPNLTSANDLEACVRARLPAARQRVPAAATADPETSTIDWAAPERRRRRAAILGQPDSGPCADLITQAVTLHERQHLQQFEDVAASLGAAFLAEFRRLAGQADRMEQLRQRFPRETAEYERRRMFQVPASVAIQDELVAHQRNIDFHRAVLEVLSRICRPPQPSADRPPVERSYRRENLYQGRTEVPVERGEEELQRSPGEGAHLDQSGGVAPPVVEEALSRAGSPLDAATRSLMEEGFGRDFSQVRLHTDGVAENSARAVNARAYTVGTDIVFAAGEYQPRTPEGRRLLAHELAHVVQQSDPAPVRRPHDGGSAASPDQAPTAFVPQPSPERRVRRLQRAWSWGRAGILGLIGGGVGALLGGVLGLGVLAGLGVGALLGGLIGGFTGKRRAGSSVEVTEPTGPNDCRLQQHHKIFPAAQMASTWLGRALDGLNRFLAAPASREVRAVGAALDRHFHSRETPVVRHIRDRLNQIRTDINERNPFTVECHGTSDPRCASFDAYVPGGNPNMLVFCPTFFALPSTEDRAGTIVHEMTHTQLGRPPIADRGYRHERVLRFLSPEEALTNAESYGMFAQELGAGQVMNDTAPRDQVSCPADWRPLVEQAVARAQRVNENAAVVLSDNRPEIFEATQDLQQQHLGGATPAHRQPATAAFEAVRTRLKQSIPIVCHPGAEARCANGRSVVVDGATLHLCAMWRQMPPPQARLWLLLGGIYQSVGGARNSFTAQNYAQLALALTERIYGVPTREAILGAPRPADAQPQ